MVVPGPQSRPRLGASVYVVTDAMPLIVRQTIQRFLVDLVPLGLGWFLHRVLGICESD